MYFIHDCFLSMICVCARECVCVVNRFYYLEKKDEAHTCMQECIRNKREGFSVFLFTI